MDQTITNQAGGLRSAASEPSASRAAPGAEPATPWQRRWCWGSLVVSAALVVALRWHTVSEPLDCDEAAYAYMAHRWLAGDRLYADVFENKPPGTYLIFAAGIAIGGYQEAAIRLVSLPFVLGTLALLWWFAWRWFGPVSAVLAALVYALVSGDPFTASETSNLEVFMNFFLALSLVATACARGSRGSGWPAAAGLALGAAATVKQVVAPHALVVLALLALDARRAVRGDRLRVWGRRAAAFVAGCALPWAACLALCAAQGVAREFLDAVFVYGPALAADAAHASGAARLILLITGNEGVGWWGKGLAPLLAMDGVALASWAVRREHGALPLVVAWTMASFAEVLLPGMFWQHYYILVVPGLVLIASGGLGRWIAAELPRGGWGWHGLRPALPLGMAALLTAAVGYLQYRHGWSLTPETLLTRHRAGGQFVSQRELGRRLQLFAGSDERMFVWGWQSPLYLYSGMDSVTPFFFTDPLMKKEAARYHPLVEPRKARIMTDLDRARPVVVYAGDPPFPQLARFLARKYVQVGDLSLGRGLYVRPDQIDRLRLATEIKP